MELVLTPTLFGLAGFAADRILGLLPVLTIAFALFGVVGMGIRAYYRYDAQMRLHEEAGPWAAPAGAPAIAPVARQLDDEPAFNIADAYLDAMSRSAT